MWAGNTIEMASTGSSGTSTGGGTSTSDTGTATGDAGSASASATGTTSGTTGDAGTESDGVTSSGSSTTGCVEVELYPDVDGDSFGDIDGAPIVGCPQDGYAELGGDCDDDNGAINPDADEVCNGVDDDCDGLKDEHSQVNSGMCEGCDVREWGGHAYWLCPGPMSWESARAVCQQYGAVDLTIVDNGDENGFLFNNMAGSNQWLGARDTSPGFAEYTWVDGSALVYDAWTGPNPDEDNGCAQMASNDSSYWRDRSCGQSYAFACESLP